MDINPDNTDQVQISDDQELAKALAGFGNDDDATTPLVPADDSTTTPPADQSTEIPDLPPLQDPAQPVVPAPTAPAAPQSESTEESDDTPATPAPENDALASIKKDALEELRPLLGKVDLPAEEKFNTYLMVIRSTDDATLIGPAHEAAQGISDESARAQALLDIVKEIDYLSHADTQNS